METLARGYEDWSILHHLKWREQNPNPYQPLLPPQKFTALSSAAPILFFLLFTAWFIIHLKLMGVGLQVDFTKIDIKIRPVFFSLVLKYSTFWISGKAVKACCLCTVSRTPFRQRRILEKPAWWTLLVTLLFICACTSSSYQIQNISIYFYGDYGYNGTQQAQLFPYSRPMHSLHLDSAAAVLGIGAGTRGEPRIYQILRIYHLCK